MPERTPTNFRRSASIRTRLTTAFMLTVLLPIVMIGIVLVASAWQGERNQVTGQLGAVASFKESSIKSWIDILKVELGNAIIGENTIEHVIVLTQATSDQPDYQESYRRIQGRFLQLIAQTQFFDEIFLIDPGGKVVLSTYIVQEGQDLKNETYFQRGLGAPYVNPPIYSPELKKNIIIAVRPVVDENGVVLGVLGGRVRMLPLITIIQEKTGLGQTGEIYLVSRDLTVLASTRANELGQTVESTGIRTALQERKEGSGIYSNSRGVQVFGLYRWLPELETVLLTEQAVAESTRRTQTMLAVNISIALASLIVAVLTSLMVTCSIATPLTELSKTATQIAAGRLELTTRFERNDEIGALAQAFTGMTTQLRAFISNLEQRVAERTRELEQRSNYLEASAKVSQATASILNPDELITQAVELIRESFNLYYVGLFLLDDEHEWAILRAGTGQAGRAMLSRSHRLKIGGRSMVGWCIENATARISLQAGEDPVRLATTELPGTRSEAALPLRSRGQVLGALTVQSDQPGAFDETAIAVLQMMADQAAVALDNARLFAESQESLESVRRAYGEVSEKAWIELLNTQSKLGYKSTDNGVTFAGDIWKPEMERAVQTGQAVVEDGQPANGQLPLAIPIKVRGKIVGVLDTYKPDGAGEWTAEEVATLETLSEQVGVALESARLYQETRRRAERERLAGEITAKIRASNHPDKILQTAVQELRQALQVKQVQVIVQARLERQDHTQQEADR